MKVKYLVVLMLVFLSVSCAGPTTYDEALDINRKKIKDAAKVGDAAFLVETKSRKILELQLLEMASVKGYSSDVVNLAKDYINSAKSTQKDLDDIAGREDIKLPDEISAEHQQLFEHAEAAERTGFDQKFMEILKMINDQERSDFTKMATEAYDPDIRAFAARQVGSIRAQSDNIERVGQQLLKTVKEQ